MGEPFIGSEAVAAGVASHSQLRRKYTRVFPDVYVTEGTELTHVMRSRAAWLWSRRRGVLAGFSAASLHGSNWVDAARPVDIIHDNRHPPPGLTTWGDRLEGDEFVWIDGVAVTTPARTAVDLACWYPLTTAVAAIDALARVTDVKMADAELLAARYRGRRGIEGARASLELVDAGAQSPKETWLRLVLVRAGLPRPQTQIRWSMNVAVRLPSWTWVGTTSRLLWSTTETSTGAITPNTPGISRDTKDYAVAGGS